MKKLILLIALLPVLCFANEPFGNIISEIVVNNPDLAAERAALVAEITGRSAENILDATEIGFDHTWAVKTGGGTKMALSVAQGFDWPGAYGARRDALQSSRSYAAKRVEAMRRSVELEARNCILQIIDANRRCELLTLVVSNIDSVTNRLLSLYEMREATALDHRKASLSLIAAKQAAIEAEQARIAALNALAALNGGTLPAGVADLNDFPKVHLMSLSDYLNLGSAEAEAARAEADLSRFDAKSAKMGLFPGFSVGYIFQREGGMSFNGFSLGLRLPKYSARTEENAAMLMAHAAELRAQAREAERNAEITSTYRAAETAAKLIAQYDEAIGSDYVGLLRKSLDGGQITFLDYFTELNFYVEQCLSLYSLQLRYQTLITSLQLR